MPFFALGFLVVWHLAGWSRPLVLLAYAVPIAALACQAHDAAAACAAVAAAGAIAFLPHLPIPRPLVFLGTISYSLYLIHFPLGVKAMNLALPRVPDPLQVPLFAALLVLVVGAAWLFHLAIERPAIGWSARMRLSPKPAPSPDSVPGLAATMAPVAAKG